MTIAIAMYVHDHSVCPQWDGAGFSAVVAELQPYTRTSWPEDNYDPWGAWLGPGTGIYACPAYNRVRGWFHSYPDLIGWGSYGYNLEGDNMGGGPLGLGGATVWTSGSEGFVPARESQVVVPSHMIAMGDATIVAGDGDAPLHGDPRLNYPIQFLGSYNPTVRGLPASDPATRAMKERHDGRYLIGFFDGHIESLRPINLFVVSNAAVEQRWNNDHLPHLEDDWRPPPP